MIYSRSYLFNFLISFYYREYVKYKRAFVHLKVATSCVRRLKLTEPHEDDCRSKEQMKWIREKWCNQIYYQFKWTTTIIGIIKVKQIKNVKSNKTRPLTLWGDNSTIALRPKCCWCRWLAKCVVVGCECEIETNV